MKPYLYGLFVAALLNICSGCNQPTGSYQSFDYNDKPGYGRIAKMSMEYEGVMRNPIIIVHGFLGSKLGLAKGDSSVWGTFYGMESRNLTPERLRNLACPMIPGQALNKIPTAVLPTAMMDSVEVKVAGIPLYINVYGRLIDTLNQAGYTPDSKPVPPNRKFHSLFEFYYDWRYDLPYNAAKLHEFVQAKREYMRKQYEQHYGIKNYDVQFDLIAHSMGGLLSRYYLRYGNQDLPEDGSMPVLDWRGSHFIDKVVIVATPNLGYLDTLWEMIHGLRLQLNAPLFPPAVIGTFHTYYQMLPTPGSKPVVFSDNPDEAADILDPATWKKYGWGLANPGYDETLQILLPDTKSPEERRKIALDHLSKCLARARQFIRAMQVKGTPPQDVAMILFAGDAYPTRRQLVIDRNSGAIANVSTEPGDGKVLATSARGDLRDGREWHPFLSSPVRWSSVFYLPAAHMGITADPIFDDNLLYFLLVYATPAQEARLIKSGLLKL